VKALHIVRTVNPCRRGLSKISNHAVIVLVFSEYPVSASLFTMALIFLLCCFGSSKDRVVLAELFGALDAVNRLHSEATAWNIMSIKKQLAQNDKSNLP
jgi:hypothetical protein